MTSPDWQPLTTLPPPANRCTITGTKGNDALRGTTGRDVICAKGGNDAMKGGGDLDACYGDRGDTKTGCP